MRGNYTTKDEIELKEGRWRGRKWMVDEIIFVLEINEGTKKISLLIFPQQSFLR